MVSQLGWGWDRETGMVKIPPGVWDAYVEVNKQAKPFRRRPFPLYERLTDLFGESTADGRDVFRPGMEVQSPALNTPTTQTALPDADDEGDESGFTNMQKHFRNNSNTLSEVIHGDRDADPQGQGKIKRTRKSTAGGMEALALSIVALSDSFHRDTEEEPGPMQNDPFAKAIQLLEEEIYSDDECAVAVEVVTCRTEWVNTYLRFHREGSCHAWLKHLIAKELDSDN